jgi:hypothetical protein
MSIYFDEPFLTLHWEEDGHIVRSVSRGAVGAEQVLRGLEVGLRLLIEKKAHRWLGDTRELGTANTIDAKRINDEWLPRAVAAGLSRMALLAPKKAVAVLTIRSFMARINGRELATEYFDDLEAARAWLCAG